MMRIVVILISIAFAISLEAQQQPLYTQFMYNKQVYNPGYVAADAAPNLGLVYRTQWIGIEGAPDFQGISFGMPLKNDRIGIGMNIKRVSIGLTKELLLEGLYGYRIDLGPGSLNLGMQLSIKNFATNFNSNDVFTTDGISNDPSVQEGSRSTQVFNFGLGAYFRSDNFFFGLSVPRVQNVELNALSAFNLSTEERHLFAMVGGRYDLNESISLTPQLLYRYVRNAPIDADLNISLSYLRKYTAGLTYRLGGDENSIGESLDLILSMQVNDNVLVGFAYDYSLSAIQTNTNGTLEFLANYRFNKYDGNAESYINPRYF